MELCKSFPLVSVVVPCFNQSRYLTEALDSILHQTYSFWECIIVNDGSTDDTEKIAKAYCSMDERFVYLFQKNAGLCAARNVGIRKSHGKYILPLDSDDYIGEKYLELAIAALENDEDIKVVYCRAYFFGLKQGEWKLPDYSLERLLGRNCIFCSAFYRKVDFDKIGGYNINMKYGFEDWDFWLSLLQEGGKVYRIDDFLFYYRIRKGSMSRSFNIDKLRYLRRKIWENHINLYSRHYLDPMECFEYVKVSDSLEYKLGKILLSPFRKILTR
ncbi:glycosyltransferase family A protein [Bacteroides sp. GD17]|jgi:glycosyltransferase involved in cell wall biosynthesis|uniref:glycosyltransferase family 2 protein n=1 Tax=Bacteroides sp. GD17 TaxID=3139826 RepID=UPI00313A9427